MKIIPWPESCHRLLGGLLLSGDRALRARSPGYPARAYVPVVQCRSLAGSTVRECLIYLVPLENLLSALTLLVARVDADHHDAAVTADHAAVFADPLHARADLHGYPFLVYLYL